MEEDDDDDDDDDSIMACPVCDLFIVQLLVSQAPSP
jgi:hypothetical protein